ncbi:MAG: phosphotransferase family protein, partial [bacterium]|nr:phosphotransferase family protein [bacterium]
MSDRKAQFEARLRVALERRLEGFRKLRNWSRLSAGASQETYRLEVELATGDCVLALRRNAGGVWYDETPPGRAGIETEALLMRLARDAGVPEPEVLASLEREDELGQGFVMEWLEGETLGTRIVRSEELAHVRPKLARQCGEVLARIHAIDTEASGLAQRLQILDPCAYVEQIYAGYRQFETPQPMIDYVASWLLDHLPQAPAMALVHNDFRNGNLMIGPEGVTAVLDWELAHIG